MLSVVMPVLDEERHIGDQLAALAAQTHDAPWELVVVDNGCIDRTLEIVHAAAGDLPSLAVVSATEQRGLNRARNAGMAAARGDFLVFCDADNVAAPGWLEAMARAAARGDLVAGRHEFERLNDAVPRAWAPWDPPDGPLDSFGFLPYAPGGNLGVWATVARRLGWDETFVFGGSDCEFCWRAQLASYKLVYAREAVMHRRFRTDLRSLARQYYAYGRGTPLLYRRFRDRGMPRNPRAARQWWMLVRGLPGVVGSRAARGFWVRGAASKLGLLVGSARFRAWYP
jgi:glycosyltransferase involved in cell wall biosynthesis